MPRFPSLRVWIYAICNMYEYMYAVLIEYDNMIMIESILLINTRMTSILHFIRTATAGNDKQHSISLHQEILFFIHRTCL